MPAVARTVEYDAVMTVTRTWAGHTGRTEVKTITDGDEIKKFIYIYLQGV